MTLTELINQLEKLRDEIGCDGNKIGSHNIKSQVYFTISNPEINLSLELDEIELTR